MRVAVFFIGAALCAQDLSNSVTLIPKADDSATGILAFREKKANGTNAVGFRAPDSIASTVTWTLPSADGTSGYCLSTNGSTVLSFADCGAGIWQRNTGLAQISPINTGDDVVLTGGDILFTPTNTSNIGTAASYANAVYSRRYESHDGTYSRIVLNSPGSGSNTGNALSILNASGANVLYVSYGGTTQAANLSTSGTLTVTGNATFSGHILNDTAGTKDIGASGNTFQTIYVENVDAAPSGQTGNYINTRKLNVMDASGGIAFWDVQANATIANADNYKIRDKGGVVRFELVNQEEVTWAALSEGRMNLHWVPYATATWDLGKSGGLWRDLYLSRNAAIGGDATVTGMVKVDVIRPDADSQTTVRTIYPEAADTYNLGTWVNRFYLVASSAITTNRINFGSGSTIELYGNLRPLTDDNFSLGEASYRYTKAWVKDLDISGTCTGCGGVPVADTTSIVKGSADATKLLRFEVDGFTTATTRVLTPQNADYTIAGTNIANTFSAAQTVSANLTTQDIIESSNEAHNIGSTSSRFNVVHSRRFESYDGSYSRIVLNSPGSGSNTGNAIAILNATGGNVLYVSYGGTTQAVNLAASGTLNVTGAAAITSNLTVGNSGSDHRIFAASQTAAIRAQLFSYDGYDTTGAGFVGTNTNHQLIFRTNDLDRGRILAAGNWEIYYNATFSGDILAAANESKNIGSTTNRFNAVYSRRFEAYDGTYSRIVLNNPGSGSNTGNALSILDASGSNVLYVSYGGTTQTVNLAASGTLNVTGTATLGNVTLGGNVSFATHNAYSIGTSGTRAAAIYGVAIDGTTVTAGTLSATSVSSSLTPSSDSGGNLGSQSVNWNYVYADGTFYIIYGASSIRHEFGQNGLTMRTTGLAQTFTATAASGNLVAGTITSGTTTTGGVYLISDGSVTYSGIGTTGTPTTLNVRKSDDSGGCTITVRGGIITASTC